MVKDVHKQHKSEYCNLHMTYGVSKPFKARKARLGRNNKKKCNCNFELIMNEICEHYGEVKD